MTANICNVSRPVASLIVSWNVIALGLSVATVSTLLVFCVQIIPFQLVRVILIASMAAENATTQFASAM